MSHDIHHALAVTRELPWGEATWAMFIVALLHDAIEDGGVTRDEMVALPVFLIDAVETLTRRGGETYDDYIERVAGNELAAAVKVADLKANIARADAAHASLLPRYERALARLTGSVAVGGLVGEPQE